MADVALVKSGLDAELARLRAEKAKHVEQLRQQGAAVAKGKGQEQAIRKLTEALRRKSAQLGTLREFQSKSDAVLGDTSGQLGSVMQRLEQAVQTQGGLADRDGLHQVRAPRRCRAGERGAMAARRARARC